VTSAQIFAGAIAVALTLLVVVSIIRWRLPSATAIFLLIFAVPAAAFATYAIRSGPAPNLTAVAVLAVILYAAGVVVVAYGIVRRLRRGKPSVWVMVTDARRQMAGLIARWLLVLWISALVFLFEPAFAIANLAVNALWMVAWLPRRFRTWSSRVETDITAPPERVFEFVSDVRNWKLYRDDVELLSVKPDGPLASGSEYVARVAIPESMRRTSYRAIEGRCRVADMVPGQSFAIRLLDQDSMVRTVVEPTVSGTRLSRTTQTTMGLLRAWSADMFNNRAMYRAMRPREQRNNQRLKQLLEAPASQ
jgi:hypothetical protein